MDMEVEAASGLASTVAQDVDVRRLERAVMDTTAGQGPSRDGRADVSDDWNKDKVVDATGQIDRRKERSEFDDAHDTNASMSGGDRDRDRPRRPSAHSAQDDERDRTRSTSRPHIQPGHDLRLSSRGRARRHEGPAPDKAKTKPKVDAKSRGRNQRILGLLTSTLSKHTKEIAGEKSLEQARLETAERKRVELDEQIQRDSRDESQRVKDMIHEKRALAGEIRRLMEEKDKALVQAKRRLRLGFHIQTEAEPPLHWLPREHTEKTRSLLQMQRDAITWVEGEETELDELLNTEDERLHSFRPRTHLEDASTVASEAVAA